MNGLVDLHSHSNQSDGSLTPEELVDLAVESGLSVLALTDHDTTAGHARFRARAQERGLTPVCGVEVSCAWDHVPGGHCHLLGLGVRDDHPGLEEALRRILSGRNVRNQIIVEKLNRLGYPITLAEVEARAGGEVVARPHFAHVLADHGLVASYQEAFDNLLGKGGPAYEDRFRMSPTDAVKLVVEAGGKPVIAHPKYLKLDTDKLRTFLVEQRGHGLWGLEVWYPTFTTQEIATYEALARELGLAPTMGSDFHGKSKPTIQLGHLAPGVPLPGPCPAGLLTAEH